VIRIMKGLLAASAIIAFAGIISERAEADGITTPVKPPNNCSIKSDTATFYEGLYQNPANLDENYWRDATTSDQWGPARPWKFPMVEGYRLIDAGPGTINGSYRQRRQQAVYTRYAVGTIRLSEGFNAAPVSPVYIPANYVQRTPTRGSDPIAGMPAGSGEYISEFIAGMPGWYGRPDNRHSHYFPLLGLHAYGLPSLGTKSMLAHWNENRNPDIAGVSDETLLAHAEYNTSRLIPAGVEATRTMLDRGGSFLPTHELALAGGSGNDPCFERYGGRMGASPGVPQLIKHPRIEDLWVVKTYLYVHRVYDLAPSGEWPIWGPSDQNTPIYVPLMLGSMNEPPVANPDFVTTSFRTPLTFNPLENDVDPDEGPQPLAITSISTAESGTIAFDPAGAVTYTPVEGFIGQVVLTYEMTDGQATASSTITIDVTDGILRPEANDDLAYTDWDTAITLQPLANDVTPMMGSLQISAVTQPEFGSVFINSDRQSLRFIPQKGRATTVSMDYTITVEGRSDSARMRVVVTEPEAGGGDWEAKPFDYQKNCREHDDGDRAPSYYEKCWNMFNNTFQN